MQTSTSLDPERVLGMFLEWAKEGIVEQIIEALPHFPHLIHAEYWVSFWNTGTQPDFVFCGVIVAADHGLQSIEVMSHYDIEIV